MRSFLYALKPIRTLQTPLASWPLNFSWMERLSQQTIFSVMPWDTHCIKAVLVMDDHEQTCQILVEILESFGFYAIRVRSGTEALDILDQEKKQSVEKRVRLVFLDWKMPEMSGVEVAQRIVQMGMMPTPHLLLVTAHSQAEVSGESADVLFDGILFKPLNPSLVLDTVMNVSGMGGVGLPQGKKRDVDAIQGILGAQVLLADDNKINQQIATELLEGNSLIVTVASDEATIFSLPESLPGINLEVGLKHMAGNQQLFLKLLLEFFVDYRDFTSKIQSSLQNDTRTAERMAHTLKGVAGSIGASSLQSTSSALEMAIREGKTDAWEELLYKLDQVFRPILQGLEVLHAAKTKTDSTLEASHPLRVDAD